MPGAAPPIKITNVGIVSKPRNAPAVRVVPELVKWLAARGVGVQVDPETATYLGGDMPVHMLPREKVAEGTQLLIVLGGDGTLLSAARAVGGRDIPLFAVNLGNLGFLTAITVDELYPQLERALQGDFQVSTRQMLHTELWRKGAIARTYEALNDTALAKADIARIIDLEVHVDDQLMCHYKADGLIVSTPTGSTAYSLSAGGPIMVPDVAAICITPICPHMLTNRPVIVPGDAVIQLTLCSDSPTFLTIDGQEGQQLEQDDRVICRRSEHTVNLIRPHGANFFDVLREKLKWGGR
ncbi:MAG: NAD(+) kinase [Bryobacterales bacterium]|nr:NAD(+) kinase [Bryobacterales bacterium]